jgi:glycerol-3-phosphate acyltransferase PlsY
MALSVVLASSAAALAAYLLGSANLAVIFSRSAFGEDVRTRGSGNAGSTNMLRTFGWRAAAVTFFGDVLKGALAVVIGRALYSAFGLAAYSIYGGYAGGIFALLGHMYPIYFKFQGGKGVATAIGAVAAAYPVLFVIVTAVGFTLAGVTGYVSAGSLTCSAGFPLLVLGSMLLENRFDPIELLLAVLLGGLIVFAHRGNIRRLLNGTENKFSPRRR